MPLPGFATLGHRRASVVPNKRGNAKRKCPCTTTSSWAAARPARSWPTGCRPGAPTRCCCARPARTRRPARSRPEIADSYSGTAYFDPRFHWTELKVHTQVVSHNNPQENRPPLRKYEQARVLGGGSSINGQMANRGAPTDYDEWASARRRGLGLERRAALLQEGRARPRLRRALSRQGRPHPRAPHPARALDRPRQGGRPRPSQAKGYQVPARPERRVRRRLLPGHPFQRRGAARVGGDGLSRRRDAQARRTSRSRPTPRSSRCCSRARAASASPPWSRARSRSSAPAR